MLTPTVCPSCGGALDDRTMLFRAHREKKVRALSEELGVPVENLASDPRMQIELGDFLDQLGFSSYCCRAHMLTAMEFVDFYNGKALPG